MRLPPLATARLPLIADRTPANPRPTPTPSSAPRAAQTPFAAFADRSLGGWLIHHAFLEPARMLRAGGAAPIAAVFAFLLFPLTLLIALICAAANAARGAATPTGRERMCDPEEWRAVPRALRTPVVEALLELRERDRPRYEALRERIRRCGFAGFHALADLPAVTQRLAAIEQIARGGALHEVRAALLALATAEALDPGPLVALGIPELWALGGAGSRVPVAAQLSSLMDRDPTAAARIVRQLGEQRIVCLQRFASLDALRGCLDAAAAPPDTRPLAIIVATRHDYNGAFNHLGAMRETLEREYRVRYVEASNDQEVVEALRRAARGERVQLLHLAGHGDPNGIYFGANDDDASVLTGDDGEEITALCHALAPTATIVSNACSTGSGGENALAPTLARTSQRRVVATTVPANAIYETTREPHPQRVLIGDTLSYRMRAGCVQLVTRPTLAPPSACGVRLVR